ncbi:ABC transporter permease [Aurantiacibacter rhizosphaerae]|uniref:ABC transporter permease n=1 Tax=Aurantiacibacter rhizosphaerae TaxID=2691582 RepID=A0A844XA22_9SPHN|nr:ABC transporter permease [Aurantiacibacter rhizosphaerae]MWV26653.1 ABC transporter permease [Aurantiacibacter rhizosphaerae]
MSPAQNAGPLDAVSIWLRKTKAIIQREIGSRYTGDAIGYLWAYIVPLAWIAVIYVLFIALDRRVPIDTDLGSFICSGVVPYLCARYAVNAILRARTAYRHILSFSTVSHNLVAGAVFLLELGNSILVFLTLLLLNYALFGFFEMHDPLLALWGFSLAVGVGGAFGYLMMSLSTIWPALSRATPIFLRPFFYISGVFYTANELTPRVVELLSWNPLFHGIEVLRSGLFEGYTSPLATNAMPLTFIAICVAIGFMVQRRRFSGEGADEDASWAI